ncbi:MAG: type I-C CRISPR-associated protein Cas8c/Csd1 [Sulfuritalea sp.]|nr:type I-C CRISPR-associated protein Cas8c/Csd1 [Sulfuritalea sp.]
MLQRLIEYAHDHVPLSEPGFTVRGIRWRIDISAGGRLPGIIPSTNDKGDERWGCPEMHGMVSGGKSHFLIDNLKTAICLEADTKDEPRHEFYVARIREAAEAIPSLRSLQMFLEDDIQLEALRATLAAPPHKAGANDNLEWRIDGRDPLADPVVIEWWRQWRKNDLGVDATADADMICFGTGTLAPAMETQPKVMRLPGGQGAGDSLIGFDKAAFTSFGLKKSANAAVSETAARQYVDALNHLVRHRSKKLADSLALHWFKGAVEDKDDVLAWLNDPRERAEATAAIAARQLFDAIRSGQRPNLGHAEYYALTLSGMSGRVMVRDWMEGRFEQLVGHIANWFEHLSITARDGQGLARDPKFMAVCGALVRDLKDFPAPTSATLWKVAVQGLPIPQPLMAQALARFRTDLVDKDQPPFNHARMGLIKAYFIRRNPGGDIHMTTGYNLTHPAAAYHCGGLLAVLANLQRAALGDVGAGVVQRFYTAASQTPGLVIGRLVGNARNHLAKLDPGLAWWYEERIAELMNRFGDAAPRILDLEGQGLFALGYYQKLAELRAGKTTTYVINEQGAQQ